MFNLGDDSELDRFSREAAGKYSPPGEPNWDKLSMELDKVMPVEEKKRRFVFFWWLLPVLLIGGVVTYWLTSKNETEQAVIKITDSNKSDNNTSVPSAPAVDEKANGSGISNNNSVSGKINATEKSSDQTSTVASEASKQSESSENNTVKPIITRSNSIAVNGLKKNASAKRTKKVASSTAVLPVVNDVSKAAQQNTQTAAVNSNTNTAAEQNKIEPKNNQTTALTAEKNTESAVESIIPKKEESIDSGPKNETVTQTTEPVSKKADNKTTAAIKGKGFSYSFLAGFDKSTVKYRYDYDPGYNIGLMAGYHFNSKWSVHTGVIYTKKNYKLDGADFTAPKGTPASYYKLDLVDGYCKMWEVPLVARYTIPKARGNSIFLSAGLSSYFMTNEDYNYYYKYLGMPVVKNTSYNSNESYLFSIVHLSAGFSKSISKSWDMQLEPYAKIPLGGVGFGSIELSSFGVNFSLQHRQPRKK